MSAPARTTQAITECVDYRGRSLLQLLQRVLQQVEAFGMRVRGRKAEHHFSQRTCYGVAFQIGCQSDVQTPQVEAREQMEFPVLLEDKLRLAFA